MRVTITGAAGIVGSEVRAELAHDHDLQLIDREPIDGHPSVVADFSEQRTSEAIAAWNAMFAGSDVVVHLAEEPYPHSAPDIVVEKNIAPTWNVMEAAVASGVPRIVYASSHWAVRRYELELEPHFRLPDGRKIGPDVVPRPNNYYGIAKISGELTGAFLVGNGQLQSFAAVRIGSFNPAEPLNDRVRVLGITAKDLRRLFRRCVEAEYTGAHIVYGVSAQDCGPFDLSNARSTLGWEPLELPS